MPGDLYYGDNLDVLRHKVATESVDLVYLDPPFNSDRTYNVNHKQSQAQQQAFVDTWHWEDSAERAFAELTGHAPQNVRVPQALPGMMRSLKEFLWESHRGTLAYLSMMAVRLIEMQRVLRPTGTLYLHCDPTESHYLKMVLDAIFGYDKFETEIIWQRSTGKGLSTRSLPNNHDVVLVYRKGKDAIWNSNEMFIPYDMDALDEKTLGKYKFKDPDGRIYRLGDITNPNPDRPNLTYEFLGHTKVWRWTRDRMLAAYEKGIIFSQAPARFRAKNGISTSERANPSGTSGQTSRR